MDRSGRDGTTPFLLHCAQAMHSRDARPAPAPRRPPRVSRAGWAIDKMIVVAYVFLVTFGAFRPAEILPITLAATGMAILWLVHVGIHHE
ncbi:MAG: hypothetical protein QOG42_1289 [Solirubrobacteraceae bacterium]|jgi:hypothetical protein|nr:hypothetical protein [Solirubrobacteraceae bacterium]